MAWEEGGGVEQVIESSSAESDCVLRCCYTAVPLN